MIKEWGKKRFPFAPNLLQYKVTVQNRYCRMSVVKWRWWLLCDCSWTCRTNWGVHAHVASLWQRRLYIRGNNIIPDVWSPQVAVLSVFHREKGCEHDRILRVQEMSHESGNAFKGWGWCYSILFCFLIVIKSHKKTKTDDAFVCLSVQHSSNIASCLIKVQ